MIPSARTRVYPRSRGDHDVVADPILELSGLPPLARGPPIAAATGRKTMRSTPARAGTTERLDHDRGGGEVYPRSRGDHLTPDFVQVIAHGLPPLARGPRHLRS